MNKIVIIGTGGQCRSVIDIIESSNDFEIEGLLGLSRSDIKDVPEMINGYKYIDSIDKINKLDVSRFYFVVAVGDNAIREEVVNNLEALIPEIRFATCVHKNASISKKARIGCGTVVMAGVVINSHVEIGKHCIINSNTTVEHDSNIGNFVTLAPGVTMGGTVSIGDHSVVSIGSTVLHNITIGSNTVVGAHSLVNKPISDRLVAYGSPARIIRSRKKGERYL